MAINPMESNNALFTSVEHQFHDNSIHAIELISPEPDAGNWNSDLVFDIDHITKWVGGGTGNYEFDVVKAHLIFKDAGELKINCSILGGGLNPVPIDRIERSELPIVKRQDYQSFQWLIALNDLNNGTIKFVASAYQLIYQAEPVRLNEQVIPPSRRSGKVQ